MTKRFFFVHQKQGRGKETILLSFVKWSVLFAFFTLVRGNSDLAVLSYFSETNKKWNPVQ